MVTIRTTYSDTSTLYCSHVSSLCNCNLLVFIEDTRGVHCAVRTNLTYCSASAGPCVRPWHGSGCQSSVCHHGSAGSIPDQSMWDLWRMKWHCNRFFSQYFCFPRQYHSTNAPHSSSSTCCSYQKGKRAKSGNLPKSNAVSDIRSVGSASTFTLVFHTALPADGYATTLNKRPAVCWHQPCVLHREAQSSTLRYKPVHSADTGPVFTLHAGLLNLVCGASSFGNIWSAGEHHEI